MQNLTVAEARLRFEDAIDELESSYGEDVDLELVLQLPYPDVLYVRDGDVLVSGNLDEMYFDMWKDDGRGWRPSTQDYEYHLEGRCDGECARRTVDWDRGGE